MIRKQRCLWYFVGDTPFRSLEEAQKADLIKLVPENWGANHPEHPAEIADWLLKNAKAIVDTLTTTPTSRLKARKSHGAVRKPRTAKALPTVS